MYWADLSTEVSKLGEEELLLLGMCDGMSDNSLPLLDGYWILQLASERAPTSLIIQLVKTYNC